MDKILQLLGLATRAKKVVSGEELVLQEVRSGRAKLVFLATDAAKNAEKKVTDKCSSYDVPLIRYGTRQELGKAIGKDERVVVAVTDAGFARSFAKLVST
ncbi:MULTISPECIES: YlxQ family RNA-binding protein [Thermoactinomyces]|jgi:ribosomal protein L7Ae-like RNA K-turn-binding protein|uniref:YlxQ family RNA-binding protein n=1 Tax=Thermoactinomyces daqus TaxID=1329516 RepID=A0A7W2AHZ1_9BACL|nr:MULTISPECIES: YlxQ family RNA-binding protein [Thermoactinomyces]MBA4542308.1 YlxQ family RNA-binding protein [Thermoactinomyces daqus]MBH8598241.1 YlxQ family RNA-binding protein [Thermoactinomyces sp. CICC 10523]MBH8604364.1 YlxQ family RNA-binding protein [Thermoactinomyces sp. CICC 10522]MBH8608521.1 YlxQ family RNA-binding protein [Thermoactinomyces sp. CICC 10521]